MIIASGVNIFPREIEEAVAKHAGVDDVAVIGVPDDVCTASASRRSWSRGRDPSSSTWGTWRRMCGNTSQSTRFRANGTSWQNCHGTPVGDYQA
nr:hypothetical protein [Saccharopolyspora pogona]